MSSKHLRCRSRMLLVSAVLLSITGSLVLSGNRAVAAQPPQEPGRQDPALDPEQLQLVRAAENARVAVIDRLIGSVISIYGEDRQGGGSGVIIDPRGIALTNHHVIQGAGTSGWGGLADGKLYPWKLVGTDPGGDVAVIQMQSESPFPYARLGDSDAVQVGDWALAMGNPFLLAEDHVPTVTLGVVSGVKRYQYGAGNNQLVYGNCIQVDSSINPGNSGGPLFNMDGEVIGINGRGSFRDRGRVNVGLGYAISANQIKNFMPELLATKLVEHGTLDANFADREGMVVCSTLNLDAPVADAGLELGDRLLEFEDAPITTANQFTNLICTLPEDWPAKLLIQKADGSRRTLHVRLFGLPYARPQMPPPQDPDQEPSPEEKRQMEKLREMMELLSAEPGMVRDAQENQRLAGQIVQRWCRAPADANRAADPRLFIIRDRLLAGERPVGAQQIWLASDGRFRIEWRIDDQPVRIFGFDGSRYWSQTQGRSSEISLVGAKVNPIIAQAICLGAPLQPQPLGNLGTMLIDGADKAQGELAYRMKLLDSDDDWFFVWLKCAGAVDQEVQLLKACSDKDAERQRGVTFSDWQLHDGVPLAHRREMVAGLAETVEYSAVASEIAIQEGLDPHLFTIPGAESR